jgi:SAM-dependent methyltransferase
LNSLKNRARQLQRRVAFEPGVLGLFLNPFYFARRGLLKHVRQLGVHISGRTLDVGCGTKPYTHLYHSSEYVGLEIDSSETRAKGRADIFYDGHRFPFPDSFFDSIVANEVLEHVFNPDEFLLEIARVLKSGGMLLLTLPFVWDEHEQPFDYARYSSFGLKSILDRHGFEIIEQRKSGDDIGVVFQLLSNYIYKQVQTKSGWLNAISTLMFIAPINIVGAAVAAVTPRNPDLYLDNVVLARRKTSDAPLLHAF